jgi:cellulose 1,4-beta-cellobiosidase
MGTGAILAVGLLAAGLVPAPLTPPRADNPYAGAVGYVNPEWSGRAAAEPGGDRVAGQPTAVWLDSIADVASLRTHLGAALTQRAGYIQFVLHNLPGRDCDRMFSEGELAPAELARYRTEFIDPIAGILAEEKYASLRVVTILEVRALPNLVVNTTPQPTATYTCDLMRANGNYLAGVRYALDRLGSIGNVYTYLDLANHAWTGRDDTLGPIVALVGGLPVDGFITNTADYAPLHEPFLTAEAKDSRWAGGNPYHEELTFAQSLRTRLIAAGFSPGIGMLIDTSRNGWGGPDRPTAASTDPDLDVRVDESRVDRRAHQNNWCNQAGAGLGERPRANPAPGIDAYVWAKPPGESDGSMMPSDTRVFHRMCDPTYLGNTANGLNPTNALPGAPDTGEWFPAHFRQLLANAYPPLS